MKNLNCFIICLLLSIVIGCTHSKPNPPELPKILEVSATKLANTIDSSFKMILGPLRDNPLVAIYPKLKGIPDSLYNIKKYLFPIDDAQAIFQAYKSGLITKEIIVNSLRKSIKDTVLCTADCVKTFVVIVTGISKKGHKYYLFDSNNNYDLSEFYSGLVMEQGKSYKNGKGKAQAGQTPVRLNTDDLYDVGLSHSSEEAPVMGVERRTEVTQLRLPLTTPKGGRAGGAETKSIPITKRMIWEDYKKVRSNKGVAGIDEETITMYEERLEDNLYMLWNRMSSGSYFPPSVLEVEIPKDDGRKRKLGIPTVNDRVAQQVIKSYLEPRFEAEFSPQSYGYRPLKSAHQAVAQVRKNVRHYHWVIDMDISSFFDRMSHELLIKAIERHVQEKWAKMYITRWIEAPIEDRKGNKRYRNGEGTPQGGVISPLLANLFLHYAFDRWLEKMYPDLCFVRYADDIIVHCNSQTEAEGVLMAIKSRLAECRLQLNEKKTKIVYCKKDHRKDKFKTVQFDFLGFSFQPRPTSTKDGEMFLGYDCAISRKSENKITEIFRKSEFHRWTGCDITHIAKEFNPKISGWINYYGKFRIHKLMRIFRIFQWRLIKWAVKRYKRFGDNMHKAGRWLRNLAHSYPGLFVHWQYGFIGA